MSGRELDYIPGLIAAYRAGLATDHVHLGYWPSGNALTWPQAQQAMTDLHLQVLDLRDGQTLVDIDCGIWGNLRNANKLLHDTTLIGVNIDPRQLANCREITARNGNRLQ